MIHWFSGLMSIRCSKLNLPSSFYLGSNVYMLASTVSSKFIRAMAEVEGFQFMVSELCA